MSNTRMPKDLSQLDFGGAVKSAHSDREYFSRADVTYNGSNSATSADFYYDVDKECSKVVFVDDSSGSLNSKYFLINSANNVDKYYVWYSVGGSGVDPAILGRTGLVVPLVSNDPASIVALGTKIILDATDNFDIKNLISSLLIENVDYGDTDNTVDGDSGFTFTTKAVGSSVLIKSITLPYENEVKYVYNEYDKIFEIFPPVTVTLGSVPSTPNVVNTTATLANTEYSVALPDNTNRFSIRTRATDTILNVGYEAGFVASNKYIEVKRAVTYNEQNLDTTSVTIYFESDQAGKVVEIIYWI